MDDLSAFLAAVKMARGHVAAHMDAPPVAEKIGRICTSMDRLLANGLISEALLDSTACQIGLPLPPRVQELSDSSSALHYLQKIMSDNPRATNGSRYLSCKTSLGSDIHLWLLQELQCASGSAGSSGALSAIRHAYHLSSDAIAGKVAAKCLLHHLVMTCAYRPESGFNLDEFSLSMGRFKPSDQAELLAFCLLYTIDFASDRDLASRIENARASAGCFTIVDISNRPRAQALNPVNIAMLKLFRPYLNASTVMELHPVLLANLATIYPEIHQRYSELLRKKTISICNTSAMENIRLVGDRWKALFAYQDNMVGIHEVRQNILACYAQMAPGENLLWDDLLVFGSDSLSPSLSPPS
ncbi:MAG: hypothetical protein SGCHY_001915 [Lobulomycetales sp.]